MSFSHNNERQLKDILGDVIRECKLTEVLDEQTVLKQYPIVVGPLINKYTEKLYLKNGVLHITLSSSVVKNELFYAREKLMNLLNDKCKNKIIKRIDLR